MGGVVEEDEGYVPFNALLRKHTQTHTHIHAHHTGVYMPLHAYPHTQPAGQTLSHESCFSLLFIFHFPFYLSLF